MKGEVIDETALVMSDVDNVGTALTDISEGAEVPPPKRSRSDRVGSITIREGIPFGHKFALTEISRGENVYKYGEVIGTASADISVGEWVHTHNCESQRGRGDIPKPENEHEGA